MIDLLGMQRAVWRSARSTTEKIVLLAIADYYSDSSPEPWPSVPTLAERCSLGRTAVLEAIAALERDGVLVVRRVQGRPNRYDLSRVAPLLARTAAPRERVASEPEAEAPEPVRHVDGSGDVVVATPHDAGPHDAAPQSVTEVPQPDHDASRSARQTSPPNGRDQSASRTGPVRLADGLQPPTSPPGGRDQSAWRTGPVRLADPKDPKKEPKKEATVARARELAAALELPIAERARLVLEEPREAQRLRPQHWPEARKIAEAYGRAIGSERPVSEFAHDSGLRAIVVLLAAGYPVDDLEWVAANVPKQAWWLRGDRVRGLGSLSVEVVSRALAERDGPRRTDERRAPDNAVTAEARRIHRNTLFENAAAGRYGADVRRAASSGVRLRGLVDQLEHAEAAGELQLERALGPAPKGAAGIRYLRQVSQGSRRTDSRRPSGV